MDKRTERNRRCRRRLFRKKKTKKGRCKRKGKNQDYICHSSLPAHSEKLQKRSVNREEKNDSQILLFQPLSHGRKLLIL